MLDEVVTGRGQHGEVVSSYKVTVSVTLLLTSMYDGGCLSYPLVLLLPGAFNCRALEGIGRSSADDRPEPWPNRNMLKNGSGQSTLIQNPALSRTMLRYGFGWSTRIQNRAWGKLRDYQEHTMTMTSYDFTQKESQY
ncbi:hypothetical protein Bbelb_008280 [Branchiostoma belcheri]|nr:hypothetical protein Bbelb_008280 [Branchiostoma belcheri]